jgi:outer membrane protein assembly factor BamE (lipoprotein component of BamABCDE complex)
MTSKPNRRATRWFLAAAIAAGVTSAYAAAGFNVTTAQEASVTTGMTADQVRAAIGRPNHIARLGNEPGVTWTYTVIDARGVGGGEAVVFDVDFGADGRVISMEEEHVDQ